MSNDRIAEIRARLDAAQTRIEHHAGWGNDAQHQRVVQINDMREVCVVADAGERAFIAHAPADIAWLLDEVSMLRMDIAEIIRKADDTADWWKQEAEKWREHRA
jgi:hypothetical protein